MNPADEIDRSTTAMQSPIADWLLWFGVLGGAMAWLLHLLLSYGVSEFGCVSAFADTRLLGFSGVAWLEAGVSVLALALAIGASVIAQRNRRLLSGEVNAARLESGDPRVFMARSGVLASGLFVFIILVQTLPILFYLREC